MTAAGRFNPPWPLENHDVELCLNLGDGTPLQYTLVNFKDWCKNSFEVVNQLRINTRNSHHRYDVILLINGVPVASACHQKIRHSPGNFRLVLGDNLWIPSGTGIHGERSMKAGIGMSALRRVVVLALLLNWPLHTGAQPSPLILSPTPGVLGATVPFCYYAGLSYSAGAVITVKVPVRREIVSDRPWQELRCEVSPTSSGSANWVEVDPDEDDPFRN